MPDNVIHVRGTRQEVRLLIQKIAAKFGGNSPEMKQVLVRMGLTLLGRIKAAFVTKARGGTDDCGLSWPPLAKSTIAYSRKHPGVPKPPVRAKFSPSWALTEKQRKRWWELYRGFGGIAPEGALYHKSNSGWAAARAWKVLKSEGAKTLMDRYGNTKVEILRDTGLLLNSLSPGVDPNSATSDPPKVDDQVFRVGSGEIIVGTNRKFAAVHHNGNAKIPQRRLWASPSQWPDSWWQDIIESGRQGLIEIMVQELAK